MNTYQRKIFVIAYSAVAIALNMILSYLKFGTMPQGGSITIASTLPLFLVCFMVGAPWSFVLGLIASLMQMLLDGFKIYHWGSIFLDYLIPLTILGLIALFKPKNPNIKKYPISFIVGIIFCTILRYSSHVLSGVILFSEYAGDQNVWAYSLGYNLFIFIDVAIALAIAIPLCFTRNFRTLLYKKLI